MSKYLTIGHFCTEFGYGRATVGRWLDDMRRDGVAIGHGKLTRINVEDARVWITERTRPRPRTLAPVVESMVLQ